MSSNYYGLEVGSINQNKRVGSMFLRVRWISRLLSFECAGDNITYNAGSTVSPTVQARYVLPSSYLNLIACVTAVNSSAVVTAVWNLCVLVTLYKINTWLCEEHTRKAILLQNQHPGLKTSEGIPSLERWRAWGQSSHPRKTQLPTWRCPQVHRLVLNLQGQRVPRL